MKIVFNIFISILIIASTTGVYVSKHYCSNHLVSFSFFTDADKCCKGDCPSCKNVNHSYKVKTKVVQSDNLSLNKSNNIISLFTLSEDEIFLLSSFTVINVVKINPPPGKSLTTVRLSQLRL